VSSAVATIRAREAVRSANILHEQIDGLEKLAWLIKSENRRV
jgi:hypothetical protein